MRATRHRRDVEDTAADLAQERRGADDATMGGRVGGILLIRGPEVSRRSLRVVLDMGNRLRRMRGRFHRWIQIKTGPQHVAEQLL